jgi:hypothetical protein
VKNQVRSIEDFSNDGVKLMSGLSAAQTTFANIEDKLASAMARREELSIEILRIDADCVGTRGSNSATKIAPLRKQATAIDGEIAVLRMEQRHAQQALDRQVAAAENVKAQQAAAAIPVTDGPERLFLVKTPNKGQIRHKAKSLGQLTARLLPGYTIAGEIFGADDSGAGGVVAAIEPTGPSIMSGLLAAFGDELVAYLSERGIGGPVVVLPHNGRDLQ